MMSPGCSGRSSLVLTKAADLVVLMGKSSSRLYYGRVRVCLFPGQNEEVNPQLGDPSLHKDPQVRIDRKTPACLAAFDLNELCQ